MTNKFTKNFRIALAVVGWIFLVISIFTSGQRIFNYFSFFTIESNILAILWFNLASINKDKNNYLYKSEVRGAIAVYLAITSIVFFVLLGKQFSDVNFINSYGLHLIIPILYIYDWLFDKNKQKIKTTVILYWLIFPALFTIYTLIRGSITHWYPYFFLSPIETGSYFHVFEYILGLLVFFLLINLLVFYINNRNVQNLLKGRK